MTEPNIPVLLKDALVQAAVTVLSQMQGKDWAFAESNSAEEPSTSIGVHLSGNANANFGLAMSYAGALRIVELFLGTPPEPSPEKNLSEDYLEVVQEFVRQIMGLTVSQLRPAFGQLSPSLAAVEDDASAQVVNACLKCGEAEILFAIKIGGASIEALAEAWTAVHAQSATADTSSNESSLKTQTPVASEEARFSPPPSSATEQASPLPSSVVVKHLQERNFDLLLDVELQVSLRFGRKEMLLKDILELSSGSVVELDRLIQEPVDLLLDHKVIARGEVVIVEGNYGVRVTEVATAQQRIQCLC